MTRSPAGPSLEAVRRRVVEDPQVNACDGDDRPAVVRAAAARAVRAEGLLLPAGELAGLVRELADDLTGLGPIEPLLRTPGVTDVLVNGPHEIWVERDGALERTTASFPDGDALRAAIHRVIGPLGLRLDRARPHVDARLADGSRLHAVLPPLAPHGPLVTIRRFAPVAHTWEGLAGDGAVPAEVAALLRAAVRDRRAVVCCGRTGTGKTTVLGLLLGEVDATERVVVVEDAAELRPACPHVVRLETRPANTEGAGEVTLRQLVREALRMRPDRIVVGEVRGVELVDVLQAMATGHEGCMTTLHARAADEALVRLEGMALLAGLPLDAARSQIAVCLDLLCVLGRDPASGARGVIEIAEMAGRGPDGALRTRQLWRRDDWVRP